jgi:hypothetical protein
LSPGSSLILDTQPTNFLFRGLFPLLLDGDVATTVAAAVGDDEYDDKATELELMALLGVEL